MATGESGIESGIGTEESGSVRSTERNGETKHNNIDSNGQSANYNNSAATSATQQQQQQHVPHNSESEPQQYKQEEQDIKPSTNDLKLHMCNGGSSAGPASNSESLDNENNNADSNDEGDITPRSGAPVVPVANGDMPTTGDTVTAVSGMDGKNYSTMTHHQEMATVTDGNANSSEHNNQPFDLHSQASSG